MLCMKPVLDSTFANHKRDVDQIQPLQDVNTMLSTILFRVANDKNRF